MVTPRFGRFPKANLVRNDYSITAREKRPGSRLPVVSVEILAMQKQDAATIRALRSNVHVGHLQRFALRFQAQGLYRKRISDLLEANSEALGNIVARKGASHRDRENEKTASHL